MAASKRILIQLDCDPQASTFDAVVAVDAGVDVLLRHGGVTADNVVPLVHGAMFTRGGADLASTAIFVGGSDVGVADAVAERVRATFFGPVRVGVVVDPSGANTTAAAAVLAVARHVTLEPGGKPQPRALVLGGTGPVGQRVARLLARRGAAVGVASRSADRAAEVAAAVRAAVPGAVVDAVGWIAAPRADTPLGRVVADADVIVAAGAAGVTLLDAGARRLATRAAVIVDLSAVPPPGIEGVIATDKGRREGSTVVYGALGVGGTKMRIHKAAIERVFRETDAFLGAEEMLAIGAALEPPRS